MSRRHLLQPDLVLSQCVMGITPEVLTSYGLKGLVLDVDETIVPVGQKTLDPDVQDWAKSIQQVVPLSLVSNNVGYDRIRQIAETLNVPFIASAGKPSRRKLRIAAIGDGPAV